MIDNTEKMRYYAELLQLSDDAIFVWRFGGGIEMWNRGAEELYGFQEAEALGQNCHDLLQTGFPCYLTEIESALRQNRRWKGELVQRTKEGRKVKVSAKFQLMRGENGVERVLEMNRDITELKQAEEMQRESEERYRAFFENSIDAILLTSPDGTIEAANAEACRIFGMTEEEIIRVGRNGLVDTSDPRLQLALEESARNGRFKGELNHRRKDGTIFPGEISSAFFTDKNNHVKTAMSIRDITERKRMEGALRESAERFRTAFENAAIGMVLTSLDTKLLKVNATFCQMVGFTESELVGHSFIEITHPDDIAENRAGIAGIISGEKFSFRMEKRYICKDGNIIWGDMSTAAFRDAQGKPFYLVTHIQDITERKQAEKALQAQQEELTAANEELQAQQEELYTAYQELQRQSDEIRNYADVANKARDEAEQRAVELDATIASIVAGVIIYDASGNIIRINEFARNLLEYTSDVYNLPYQERPARLKLYKSDGIPYEIEEAPLYRALRGEVIRDEEMMIAKVPGKPVWLSATFAPIEGKKDNLMGVILIFNDITEQKRKAEDLLASERELLKVTLNSLGEGVVATDQDGRIIFINETAINLTGYSEDEATGKPLHKILYCIDDRTGEPILAGDFQKEFRGPVLVTRDLKEVPIAMNRSPITTTDGRNIGTVTVFQDITEKQKIEQELLKTAKLDSLGILAGGVAHDFNNILAGILANLQLAALKQKKHLDIAKYLEDTIEITRKASELTKQLLTFAKGGDPVKKSAPIANLVKDTVQFALSGSKVKAEFHLPEDLWVVDIDEGQISQVINNLTINAEQAMPTSGTLEIYGENVVFETAGPYTPGQYVKLTVKDHGIGIPAELINKIFDPFFTTKTTGNGLGLSTSYSIIKKHKGYLEVESALGIGTTFSVLLPASIEELTFKKSHKEIAASGEAKILLMDDEDTIRNVGGEMLTCFGYRVTLARAGQEAIILYKQAKEIGEPFDVVIMDLTVPGGLGGIETMSILRRIDPEIKAIISSGYADDPVMSDYERYGFRGVVIKPYKFDELNEVLNKVIYKKQLPLDLTY